MLKKTLSVLACSCAFALPVVASSSASAALTYQQTIEAQNPLAYWRFNDGPLGAGATIAADVGAAYSTALNASGVTEGNAGPNLPGFGAGNTSFTYDGTTNAITYQLLDTNQQVMSSDAGSVSYWFKRNENPNGGPTSVLFFGTDKTGTGSADDLFTDNTLGTYLTNGGRAGFVIGASAANRQIGIISSPYPYLYSDNKWHQMVATWDRSTGDVALYLDGGTGGGLTSSLTFTATYDGVGGNPALWDSFQFTTDRFGKARYSSSRFFPGDADELAVWNSALSESQVLAQWSAAEVPEPTTLALVAAGGLCMLGRRRGRRA